MGQESLIIAVIVIVLTVIGGAAAFFVWHRLHSTRWRGESIEMRRVRERDSEGRRVRERGSDGHRVREHDPDGPSIADIVRDSPGHSARGTRRDEGSGGLSLADIFNQPPTQSGKSSASPSKKRKKRDIGGEPQLSLIAANAESSSTLLVPKPTTQAERSTASLVGKGRGKRAPGKRQRPIENVESSDTQLIRVESSPSCSQDESSIKSEP